MRTFGPDPIFSIGGTSVRQATPRNSPSVINAVFNFRNFWDGRAQNDFNGVSPFGARDTAARVGHVNASGGVDRVAVSLADSSLASQAVAPPGNAVEMSADGRTLSDVGRKLLSLKPLGEQAVSAGDSVLGADADPSGRGLSTSYRALIEQAFTPDWWDSNATLAAPDGRRFSLMEFNFPLFWGLAIQAYESTLVSDQTPADRFFAGDTTALSASAQAGLDVFRGPGRCSTCHLGAGLSDATAANVAATGLTSTDGGRAIDTGFLNIGVRPTASDPGLGGLDPFGNPLSEARRAGSTNDKVSGSFKVPQLRNVALTAPYFHNGGQMTLRQVVDFYNRQGDFANDEQSGVLGNLGLTETQKNDLVAFLQSLTDPRVADASAPFDHPQLFVPSGERTGANGAVVTDAAGHAVDCFLQVPATGAAGGAALPPFPTFTGPCTTPPPLPGGAAPVTAAPAPTAPAPAPSSGAGARPRRCAGRRPAGATRCVVPRLTGHTLHRRAADAPARALRPRSRHPRGRPRAAAGRAPPGPEGGQPAHGRDAGAADPEPGPRRARVSGGLSARAARCARRPRRPAATGRAPSPGRRGD